MNDSIWFQFSDSLQYFITVGYIKLYVRHCHRYCSVLNTVVSGVNIRTDTNMSTPVNFIHHVVSKLPINACYEYLHTTNSVS